MANARPIYFTNTLGGDKEEFTSLQQGEVRMYNCGPTVYDRATVGNMRAYVLADLTRRVLEYNDYTVKQVINITDVGHLTSDGDVGEDKLEKRAGETGESAQDIAKKYTELFFDDIKRLNLNTENTEFPRATAYIAEQIAMIQTLEEAGYAYRISDGVYFDTAAFKDYGKLGDIPTEQLEEGARIEKNEEKRNPTDFALWKLSQEGEKRQQEWNSPWGVGFPGWHIECSAMSRALLGRQLDIHTGGIDHIPVHHNNEIAQSEGANKKKFVNYWLHNAFITVEGRRMGKSMGNLINLDQLQDRGIAALSYRYWLLTAHYRTPANFTWEALEGAHTALTKLHRFVEELPSESEGSIDSLFEGRFREFVNDDLDTPKAIALVWDLVKDDEVSPEDKRATILSFDTVLGVGLQEAIDGSSEELLGHTKKISVSDAPDEVRELVEEREKARAEQDFAKADEIRDKIYSQGYSIKDTDEGPRLSEN